MEHIVKYHQYCPLCKEAGTNENKDPCEECLSYPVNEDSRKPLYFKPKTEETQTTRKKGSVNNYGTLNSFYRHD